MTSIRVSWHLKQGIVHFSRILDPICWFNDCILWLELRYQKVGLPVYYKLSHHTQSNIYLHSKDFFKKPLQCLDFCIHLLEFNIYNKTNYMNRKNIKFWKISRIPPSTKNEVFSQLIMGKSFLSIWAIISWTSTPIPLGAIPLAISLGTNTSYKSSSKNTSIAIKQAN